MLASGSGSYIFLPFRGRKQFEPRSHFFRLFLHLMSHHLSIPQPCLCPQFPVSLSKFLIPGSRRKPIFPPFPSSALIATFSRLLRPQFSRGTVFKKIFLSPRYARTCFSDGLLITSKKKSPLGAMFYPFSWSFLGSFRARVALALSLPCRCNTTVPQR